MSSRVKRPSMYPGGEEPGEPADHGQEHHAHQVKAEGVRRVGQHHPGQTVVEDGGGQDDADSPGTQGDTDGNEFSRRRRKSGLSP